MFNVVIFGAPGSGKGTQSELIAEKNNLFHISTGDVLRKEIASGSELGENISSYTSKGNLIPDSLMLDILSKVVDENDQVNGYIFDGFPRTIPQAEALEAMMNAKGKPISIVLALDVENEELVTRLLKRGEISGRADDNMETIQTRLKVYEEKTAPILNFYQEKGLLEPIAGVGTIEDIFGRIQQKIENKK